MIVTPWPRRARAWASGSIRATNVPFGRIPNGASIAMRSGLTVGAPGGRAVRAGADGAEGTMRSILRAHSVGALA
ncbi:MAG: hypothetical protein OHK0015_25530 [Chloroflexi bacterium OHK40]